MSTKSSINRRAGFQLLLLVAVVFGIGFYNRCKSNHSASYEDDHVALYASSDYANGYPDVYLGSDESWNDYRKSYLNYAGVIPVVGDGHINNMNVSVDCLLFPDGTIVGRYVNSKGISLDVNGYVESESGELRIHLGHASASTLSSWYLHSIEWESDNENYVYEGEWGKKRLSSRMVFRKLNN